MKFEHRLKVLEHEVRLRARLCDPDRERTGARVAAHVVCALIESMGTRFTDPARVRERWAEESLAAQHEGRAMDCSFWKEFWPAVAVTSRPPQNGTPEEALPGPEHEA